MTRFEKHLSILLWTMAILTMLAMAGCGNNGEPDAISGGESKKINLPKPPSLPSLPNLPSSTSSAVPSTTNGTTGAVQPAATSTGSKVEVCEYAGRFNGDRPTWYCGKDMADYPASFLVDISGCFTKTVKNNGHRYQDSQLIAKQSDVSGRGLALVAVASCTSTTASVRYLL